MTQFRQTPLSVPTDYSEPTVGYSRSLDLKQISHYIKHGGEGSPLPFGAWLWLASELDVARLWLVSGLDVARLWSQTPSGLVPHLCQVGDVCVIPSDECGAVTLLSLARRAHHSHSSETLLLLYLEPRLLNNAWRGGGSSTQALR